LNPFGFPTPDYEMLKWVFPSNDLRRWLYGNLSVDDDATTIVLAHHPARMWYPTYDTTKTDSMPMILAASRATRFFLSTKSYGQEPTFLHQGNVLEAMVPALSENAAVGILTFDNHRAMYYLVPLTADDRPVALLTNPVSTRMISGLDVFNEGTFEVRAIVFGRGNVVLNVSGPFEGTLKKVRDLDDSVSLWSLPVANLAFGYYTLNLSGDWSGGFNFVVGNTIRGFEEEFYVKEPTVAYQFLFALFLLVALFLGVPVDVTGISDYFDEWIQDTGRESYWLAAVFGGFIVIKHRLVRMPRWFQVLLFCAVIWPLALPIAIFTTDGKVAMLWLWGYVCGGKAFGLFDGPRLSLFYILFVIFPIMLVASAAVGTLLKSPAVIVDLIVYLAGIGGNMYAAYSIADICGNTAGGTSPMFVFIPVILHVSLWISVVYVLKLGNLTRLSSVILLSSHD
jgi:hypothetical protein